MLLVMKIRPIPGDLQPAQYPRGYMKFKDYRFIMTYFNKADSPY
jgi:hypothetical protein